MRNLAIVIFTLGNLFALQAQELNCIVTINVGPRVQTTDRSVFTDMKNAFQQFLNTRKWTNDSYLAHEKINCSMLININDMPAIGIFSASVQVQAARPVYNTNYNSLTFNFADRDWEFDYLESQPLEFNDNTYTSNITSMLAFYAYTIIGMDYDTFSELGGTPYFQRALQVVNNAQSSNRPGWQSVGSIRNRYWLIENLINPQFADVRKNQYTYHRLGLDTFDKDPDTSREIILKGLKDVKKARDINPNAIVIISFLDAKAKEISNIFSSGQLPIRKEAYDLLTTIDPTNRAGYEKILKN
ncbi:MAG: DUF4835 family protein [Cyclobacteriaceae bacterium]|nr:DUF4835 family protein [Cyclobacteriaceae bacterium]UYN88075.1 MAG: DUF4835 family protein [Cyclobacteriaceae bacterium]